MFENREISLNYITIDKTLIRCDLIKYYHEINGCSEESNSCLEVVMTDGEKLYFRNVTLDDIKKLLVDW